MKHDHKPTEKLKIILFSSVMLLPLIAVGVTALTHVFNEKVESPNYEVEEQILYDVGQIDIQDTYIEYGKAYQYSGSTSGLASELGNRSYEYIKIDFKNNGTKIYNIPESNNLTLTFRQTPNNSQKIQICIVDINQNYTILIEELRSNYIVDNLYIVPTNNGNLFGLTGHYTQYGKVVPKTSPIYTEINIFETTNPNTNIFYYAVDRLKESNLFNWVNESPLKQPINDFTGIFGIQQDNFITLLVNYWLNIMLMYIIFDIVIEIFILISHIFIKEV